jgi:hypothetical protein
MNVAAQLLDEYAEELFTLLDKDEPDDLDRARLILMANGLKNMAQDLRGDGGHEGSRRRQIWWQA